MDRRKLLMLGGKTPYSHVVKALFGANLVAYWPQLETSGTVAADVSGNARNGAYTGVDLSNIAGPMGGSHPYFDGANDYNNVFSLGLQAAFPKQLGSLAIWARVDVAAVWTDNVYRQAVRLFADSSNYVLIDKHQSDGTYRLIYNANGTAKSLTPAGGGSLAWVHLGITWTLAGDAVIGYINGAKTGDTQTSLGTWGAPNIGTTTSLVGASTNVPALVWKGWLGHCVLTNRVITPGEMAILAGV